MHTTGLTKRLSAWIAGRQDSAPAPRLEHHLRRMILDHLGGVVAGSAGEVSATVAQHVDALYGVGDVTAVGFGSRTALGAALINGTSAHGLETDDGYTPGSFHPTCVVLPAVFALAQSTHASASRILEAAAIGMEISCRIAAAGHPSTRRRGFHNTPVAGVFGAAAASAHLLGLDEEQTANALGIAGSHASGLFEFLGQSADVKRFHPGKAARDGIASAHLAATGLTGPTTILEGPDGFFAAYAGTHEGAWNADVLTDGLGEDWVVFDTYIKPYPCCRHLHGAIDAAIAIADDLDPARISGVRIDTFRIAAGHDSREVDTMMGAQLSVPFAVAVALRRRSVTLSDFQEDARRDPLTRELADVIEVFEEEAAEAAYPLAGRPAEVTVTLVDGQRFSHRVEYPYGEPTNPVTDRDLEDKVRRLVEPVIGKDGAESLIEDCWTFTDVDFLAALDRDIRTAR